MSRAALLPTPGDPYLTAAWIQSFKRFWKDEIDKLYVCINSPMKDELFDYVVDEFNSLGAEIITFKRFNDHGPSITKLLDICTEDYVYIVEDDFFLQKTGQLDQWFRAVESGEVDMIGSMRGSAHPELCKAVARRHGLTGAEVHQPHFWPCLFVGKASDLRRTDKNFAAKRWPKGVEIVPGLISQDDTWAGDTFVWMSIQLRELGLNVRQVDQNRLIDVISRRTKTPDWIHVGSGSASFNGSLLTKDMRPIGRPQDKQESVRGFPNVPDENIRQHFERKYTWWKIFNNCFPIRSNAIFNQEYKESIERSIVGCNLRSRMIKLHEPKFRDMIQPLIQ